MPPDEKESIDESVYNDMDRWTMKGSNVIIEALREAAFGGLNFVSLLVKIRRKPHSRGSVGTLDEGAIASQKL